MLAEPEKLAKARTLKVSEPRGDQPPTIQLDKDKKSSRTVHPEFRQGHRNAGREMAGGRHVRDH